MGEGHSAAVPLFAKQEPQSQSCLTRVDLGGLRGASGGWRPVTAIAEAERRRKEGGQVYGGGGLKPGVTPESHTNFPPPVRASSVWSSNA